MLHSVYIGLGSNLDFPATQIDIAIEKIEAQVPALMDSCLLSISSYYQNPPVGPQDQPDFVNAVVHIQTTLSPIELLLSLQNIESEMGRVKTRVWGPRVIDCDILLYDNLVLELPNITIPHPQMLNRAFVLYPLHEIAKDLILPNGEPLVRYIASCHGESLVKLIKEYA